MPRTADVSGHTSYIIVIYSERMVADTVHVRDTVCSGPRSLDTVTAWRQTDGDTWSRSGAACSCPARRLPYHVEYAIKLSGKAAPRLCVLNQAVGDDPAYYLRFYDRLADSPAEVRHLSLFPMPNVADPEDFLLSQDIIFVGGGSVANMVAVWRVHGIDADPAQGVARGHRAGRLVGRRHLLVRGRDHRLLRRQAAAVHRRARDAGGQLLPALQLRAERRPLYQRLVAEGTLPGGLACDDGVGAHYVDDALAEMIADRADGAAYRVTPDGDGRLHRDRAPGPLPRRVAASAPPARSCCYPMTGPDHGCRPSAEMAPVRTRNSAGQGSVIRPARASGWSD